MKKQQFAKVFQAVIAVVTWFALVTQLYIMFGLKATRVPEMLIRYLSYFTIQTNLLVAICFTALVLAPKNAAATFFSKQQTITAITVYIVIVGLIYNTILRFLWVPQGLQQLVDELLHSAVPVLVLLYWLFMTNKNLLQLKNILSWLIYPFAYIVYVLIRGAISGFYPYPFINTANLGLNKVLVNSVGIAVVFTFMSLLLVGLGKGISSKK